ncbi:MAG: alanine:cation symporter family protein [Vicinamibacterales bacterium]|nr:alanine:cation symporter family protein [Vicinamibacterales bacterium]
MLTTLANAVQAIADALFMPWTILVLLGTGLYLSVRLGFVQIVRFPEAARTMVASQQQGGAGGTLTPFQAFMTALAASIGMGNIAGVATAIVSGGPGALFWIWAYGFFATAIKFCEAGSVSCAATPSLRARCTTCGTGWGRRRSPGSTPWSPGSRPSPRLAALLTTPFTQPNSMAIVLKSQFGVPTWVAGVAIGVLTWLVIIGGVKSIGRAAEKLSPLKVGLYLAGGLIVILAHAGRIPDVLATVFREAFTLRAAAGTVAGAGVLVALRYGLARGIYANEAGYGTAAVAYGTARSDRPEQQGLNALMEVFIISFITSTISAMTLLLSGVAEQSIETIRGGGQGLLSTAAVAAAFNSVMPVFGGWIVAFCAFLFGYTTLIGWAFYGEQFLEYILFRTADGRGGASGQGGTEAGRVETRKRRFKLAYRWVYCLLIPLGAVAKVDVVWAWGDLMNGLQIFPNVIGLIGLAGIAGAIARRR